MGHSTHAVGRLSACESWLKAFAFSISPPPALDRSAGVPEIQRTSGQFNNNNGDSDVLLRPPCDSTPAESPNAADRTLIRPTRFSHDAPRLEYSHADLPRLCHGHHLHVPDHDQTSVGVDCIDSGSNPVRTVWRLFQQNRPDDAGRHQQTGANRRHADVRHSLLRPDDRLWPVRPGRTQDPQAGQRRPAESLRWHRRAGLGCFARW